LKRRIKIGSIIKLALLLILLGVFFGPSTFYLLMDKWAINRAVAHAKSIRLEHYRNAIDNFGTEQIIASKDLAPEDFHRVSDAFPVGLDASFPGLVPMCIFNPHHRIIITDASGNMTAIRVCFECDHTEITHGDQPYGDTHVTPFIWMRTLRKFFADEGMPNSPELYRRAYSQQPETNQAPATNQ
jgi:hypothetical protein